MSNEMEMLFNEDNMFRTIKRGQIVTGTIILEKEAEFYVDLNYKSEGVLPKSEVSDIEEIHVGDALSLKVMKIDENMGEVLLSQKKAEEANVWNDLKVGQIVDVKITDKNDKGLIGEYKGSIRGFIPLSHISLKYSTDTEFEKYKNNKIKVEIIEVIPKKKLVLSIKNILLKEKEDAKKDFVNKMNQEEIYKGTVKDIKEYGMFVELDGITGLVHKSEVSWDRNVDLSKIYKVGDTVNVKILNFDKEKEKLSLSIKSLEKNPWEDFIENYKADDMIKGIVKTIKDFGIFVKLNSSVDGFVHISNMSYEFIKNPKDIVKIGDNIEVKILNIDMENKKVELTMNFNQEED